MRRCLTPVVFAAAMSMSLPALAQNCPPGAWFCEQADVQTPPSPAEAPVQRQAPPPPQAIQDDEDVAPAPPPPPHRSSRGAPPVVVYQPAPSAPPTTRVIIIAPGYGGGYSGGYYAPPRPRLVRAVPPPAPQAPPPKWHPVNTKWGLNLRVEGMTFGHNSAASQDSGMGGLGISLRYRPISHFAFDLGVDVLSGTDYNGFHRTETPITLSGMLFLNPRSPVQLYLLGGMNFSQAKVSSEFGSPLLSSNGDGTFGADYSYFGGHGGAGLELRASRHFALNVDVVGFMRKRTDSGLTPEFSDPDRGTTNSSGGALFRGGLTFWW
jgi:hypothetical protein